MHGVVCVWHVGVSVEESEERCMESCVFGRLACQWKRVTRVDSNKSQESCVFVKRSCGGGDTYGSTALVRSF